MPGEKSYRNTFIGLKIKMGNGKIIALGRCPNCGYLGCELAKEHDWIISCPGCGIEYTLKAWKELVENIELFNEMIEKYKRRIVMGKINLNDVALDVSIDEGGAVEVNIAQIKEVMSVFLRKLSVYEDDEILEVVSRYKQPSEPEKIV